MIDKLSARIGIGENVNSPPDGQTRPPISANIKHASYLCFQDQDVVASKSVLFHKQSEPYIPQLIKDTLPYFLGAVADDYVLKIQQLAKKRRRLLELKKEFEEAEQLKTQASNQAVTLLAEARSLGLVKPIGKVDELQEIFEILAPLRNYTPPLSKADPENDSYLSLQNEIFEIENEIARLDDRLSASRNFVSGTGGFKSEAEEQLKRLKTIGLFQTQVRKQCPTCSSDSEFGIVVESLVSRSIDKLHHELSTVEKEQPKISGHVEKLEEQRRNLIESFRVLNRRLEVLVNERVSARLLRDSSLRTGIVLGKIALWADTVNLSGNNSVLLADIENLEHEVAVLAQALDIQSTKERLASILSKISKDMSKASEELHLEHSAHPVRFDLKELTVVLDLEHPTQLKQVGSGENHVGYHLACLTALHRYFAVNQRPVPRFQIYDQPSQVYYPAESQDDSGSLEVIRDEDRVGLERMYAFLFNYVRSMKGQIQLILIDHAKPDNAEFRSYIVEEWRGGRALIPKDW